MTCQEPGCDKSALSHGWCRPHGNEEINQAPYDPTLEGLCKMVACGKPIHAKQMCNRHYRRALRTSRGWKPRSLPKVCIIRGCQRVTLYRGLCAMHLERDKRYGDPLRPSSQPTPPQRLCTVKGCGRSHRCRGWCDMHYSRWRRWGNPLKKVEGGRRRNSGPCAVEGCDGDNVVRGYCSVHYSRLMRWGDPLAGATRRGFKSLCVIEGCERLHYGDGLCLPHFMRRRDTGDPLTPYVLGTKPCLICSKEFPIRSSHWWQAYCSPQCKGRAQRRRIAGWLPPQPPRVPALGESHYGGTSPV